MCTRTGAKFYKRYPTATGLLELAVPGVSTDGQEAIGYCGLRTGLLGGIGYLVLLRQENGRWAVKTARDLWMS